MIWLYSEPNTAVTFPKPLAFQPEPTSTITPPRASTGQKPFTRYRPSPRKTIHQVSSSHTASITWPSFSFLMKLMAMPVMICTKPRAMAPTRIIMVSFRGVNRAGSSKVLPGSISLNSWVRKSPKKPPVRAPMIKVLTPHRPSRPKKWPMVPEGRFFFSTITEASIISRP